MLTQLRRELESGANRYDRPGELLLAAFDGEQLVGLCGLNRDPFSPAAEKVGRVRRLYVLPGHRRKGTATALVDAIEDAARNEFEVLSVFTTDPGAGLFYEARGFRRVAGMPRRSHELTLSDG